MDQPSMPPFAPHQGSSSDQLEEKQTSRTQYVPHEEITDNLRTRECSKKCSWENNEDKFLTESKNSYNVSLHQTKKLIML